jgi:hypothetical protein
VSLCRQHSRSDFSRGLIARIHLIPAKPRGL